MKLITNLKNGSKLVTNLSDKVRFSASGKYTLNPKQLRKRLEGTSKEMAGLEFKNFKILQ